TPTVTASATGFSSATQVETITAGTATVLAFSTGAQALTAGNCSGTVTVQSRDSLGNVSNVGSATTVNLTSASTGNTFYSDSTCTTAVASVTIAASASSQNFWFKDTKSGSPTETAAATGFTSATQGETIAAGTANKLSFTSAAKNQ